MTMSPNMTKLSRILRLTSFGWATLAALVLALWYFHA
jgi:hypothetical protein